MDSRDQGSIYRALFELNRRIGGVEEETYASGSLAMSSAPERLSETSRLHRLVEQDGTDFPRLGARDPDMLNYWFPHINILVQHNRLTTQEITEVRAFAQDIDSNDRWDHHRSSLTKWLVINSEFRVVARLRKEDGDPLWVLSAARQLSHRASNLKTTQTQRVWHKHTLIQRASISWIGDYAKQIQPLSVRVLKRATVQPLILSDSLADLVVLYAWPAVAPVMRTKFLSNEWTVALDRLLSQAHVLSEPLAVISHRASAQQPITIDEALALLDALDALDAMAIQEIQDGDGS